MPSSCQNMIIHKNDFASIILIENKIVLQTCKGIKLLYLEASTR